MLATQKQLNYIKWIRSEINFCDERVPHKEDREKRDLCLKDYFDLYVKIESGELNKYEASNFITKWKDLPNKIYISRSSASYSGPNEREVGLYCESDLFLTEMFY